MCGIAKKRNKRYITIPNIVENAHTFFFFGSVLVHFFNTMLKNNAITTNRNICIFYSFVRLKHGVMCCCCFFSVYNAEHDFGLVVFSICDVNSQVENLFCKVLNLQLLLFNSNDFNSVVSRFFNFSIFFTLSCGQLFHNCHRFIYADAKSGLSY